jgi:hypothetical protein
MNEVATDAAVGAIDLLAGDSAPLREFLFPGFGNLLRVQYWSESILGEALFGCLLDGIRWRHTEVVFAGFVERDRLLRQMVVFANVVFLNTLMEDMQAR